MFDSYLSILAWIPPTIYVFAGWPQVITNYRDQSTRGLSHRMIFLAAIGSITKLLYIYYLDLNLAMKVMRPFAFMTVTTLGLQGFLYSRSFQIRRNFILAYAGLYTLGLMAAMIGMIYPDQVGHVAGWISAGVLVVYQIPQIYKNYRRKTLRGLNFYYLTLLCTAGLFEMINALVFQMPIQSFLNGLRGVIMYLIFCYQYWLYGMGPEKSTEKSEYGV